MSKRFSASKKTMIYKKCDCHCAYCGKELGWVDMCVDHVQPKSQGGSNHIDNLMPSCRSCNSSKSTMSLDDFRLKTAVHKNADFLSFSVAQIKLLHQKGVFDFLGIDCKHTFFFEKFNHNN